MLLDGRGTERALSAAVTYLRLAVLAGHVDAKESLAHLENKIEQLSDLFITLGELNNEDDSTGKKMSVEQQRSIVNLILADKKVNGPDSLTITHHDITVVLNDLEGIIVDQDCFQMQVLNGCRKHIATFLTEGVEHYNQENGTQIRLMTQEPALPPDMWRYLGEYMSMGSNIRLANAAKQYNHIHEHEDSWQGRLREGSLSNQNPVTPAKELFLTCPAARKGKHILSDAKGRTEVHEQWNKDPVLKWYVTDPMLIQRVRNGQRTLAEINEAGKQIQAALQGKNHEVRQISSHPWIRLRISDAIKNALSETWIQARIIDGTLTWERVADFTWATYGALDNPEVQRFLELEQNWPYIGHVASFSDSAADILENDWARERLADGTLTWQQLSGVTSGAIALLNKEVQGFLDLDQNRQYIGQVVSFPLYDALALANVWVRKQLTDGTLTWKQLYVAGGGADILCNPEIQRFLDLEQNRQYIGHVVSFSYISAGGALKNAWVRKQLTEGTLTWKQLTAITWDGRRALCNEEVQRLLELDQNRQYIGQLASFSGCVTDALQKLMVRNQLTDETKPSTQFAELTPDESKALCDQAIQK